MYFFLVCYIYLLPSMTLALIMMSDNFGILSTLLKKQCSLAELPICFILNFFSM